MATRTSSSARVLRLALIVIALVAGWVFILWQNRFYLTPAVVFAMLGYFAVVMTTYNLWRTGVAAVAANDEDDGEAAWGRPHGARDELDREKRTMLKAIKEAEFDHGMGKLSKRDADEMIATYRARAIEVIKELERLDAGEAGTVRERIEREVKARLELDAKAGEAKAKKAKKGGKPDAVKAAAVKGNVAEAEQSGAEGLDEARAARLEAVESKAEAPETEAPKTVEPKTVEPKAVEPKAVEPIAVEPIAATPKAEEPNAASPTAEAVATAVEAADAEPPREAAKEATP